MTLGEVEEGSSICIDANVFIYHFTGASRDCTDFLARCEGMELRGSTAAVVVAEVCHRLMMIEAAERKLVTGGNVARKLGTKTEIVRRLVAYESAVEAIPLMSIEVVPLTMATIRQGLRLQRRHGLLTNDALLLATMQELGVGLLASADQRLGGVAEIELVSPGDLS